jgi:hypothetical protein
VSEGALILAVDPGRWKCGLAVLEVPHGRVIVRRVVPTAGLIPAARALGERHALTLAVVGDRTGSAEIRQALTSALPGLAVRTVREAGTTLEARSLYFEDHPPRGWRRVLPRSLQLPPEPYDDYSAIVLGRRFLARRGLPERP